MPVVPGGNPQLVGTVTVKYVTKGAEEAISVGERYQNVVQAILGSSERMARSVPMRDLATDTTLAQEAVQSVSRTYDKFTQSLIRHEGNVEKMSKRELSYLTEARDGTEQLLEAYRRYMYETEGGELFKKKELDLLIERNKTFESHIQLLGKTVELNKDYKKSQEEFSDNLKKNVGGAFSKIAKVAKETFGELFPKNIGESKQALDALTSSLSSVAKTGMTFGKKIFGTIKDVRSLLSIKQQVKGNQSANLAQVAGSKGITNQLGQVGASAAQTGGKLSRLTGILGQLGGGLASGSGMLARFGSMLLGLGPIGAIVIAVIVAVGVAFVGFVAAIKLAIVGFKQVTELQEHYRLSAFRAAGSISELTKATSELGFSTMMGNKEAKEAITALVEVGVSGETLRRGFKNASGEVVYGTEALKSASETLMIFHKTTGIAQHEIAQFQKTMLALGMGMDDVQESMGRMLKAQRVIGLTAGDMAQSMKQVVKMQSAFQTSLTSTNIVKFTQDLTVLYGKARQAGVGIESVSSLVDKMNRGMDESAMTIAAFSGRLGEFINTKDASTQLAIMQDGIETIFLRFKHLPTQVFKGLINDLGITEDQIQMVRKKLGDFSNDELQNFKKNEAIKQFNDSFTESTKTLTQVLTMLFEPLLSLATSALQPFQEEVVGLGDWLKTEMIPLWVEIKGLIEDIFGVRFAESNTLRDFLRTLIQGLTKAVEWARDLLDIFKMVIKTFMAFVHGMSEMGWLGVLIPPLGIAAGTLNAMAEMSDQMADRDIRRAEDTKDALVRIKEDERKKMLAAQGVVSEESEDLQKKLEERIAKSKSVFPLYDQELRDHYKKQYGYDIAKAYSNVANTTTAAATAVATNARAVVEGTASTNLAQRAEPEIPRSSTIPTVKHTEELKTSGVDNLAVLIERTEETNMLLAMIYDKSDPNIKDMAEALKVMRDQKQYYQSHRRAATMGSKAAQWGAGD